MTAIKSILSIFSASASLLAIAQHPTEKLNDPPPYNAPPYTALMNSVRITIPEEDRATANLILLPGSLDHAKELDVNLREDSFRPILSRLDEADWQGNWLKPYEKNSSEHRWLATVVRPTIEAGELSNMPSAEFERLTHNPKLSNLVCRGTQYSLAYCSGSAPHNDFVRNEFFFDEEGHHTLIACIDLPEIHFFSCRHFFLTPSIDSVAVVNYSSREELLQWQRNENGITKFLDSFRTAN